MLLPLDDILFPDDCEVVDLPLHSQRIYLIQKNGSSSLRHLKFTNKLNSFVNNELMQLDYVDVYIRNPRSRYVSGVNTFLQYLSRDHPELDQNTAYWFVNNFNFLNRHHLPQFHWLLNLSRFIRADCKIRLRDFSDFGKYVSVKRLPNDVSPPTQQFVDNLIKSSHDVDHWFFVDQILQSLSGSALTWQEIVDYYRSNHRDLFELMTKKIRILSSALSKN
jgi:hypothetical protein